MDVIEFSEVILKKMREEATSTSGVVDVGKRLASLRELTNEMNDFVRTYQFKDVGEEIQFFKEIKPVVLSQYYYQRALFDELLFDSFNDEQARDRRRHDTLQKLQKFAKRNRVFYEYCISGSVQLDQQYFTRSRKPQFNINYDSTFTTGYDITLAKILANELLKDHVVTSLQRSLKVSTLKSGLAWTDSKVALVELIYALHTAGCYNRGNADVKDIVEFFEHAFSVSVGNYARVFYEIRLRKGGQLNFLNSLTERLKRLMDQMN